MGSIKLANARKTATNSIGGKMRKSVIIFLGLAGSAVLTIIGYGLSTRPLPKLLAKIDQAAPIQARAIAMSQTKVPKIIDYPKAGVVIRYLGDSKNEAEAEYMIRTPENLRDVANQYSIVIENTSDKAIIALSIGVSRYMNGKEKPITNYLQSEAIQPRLSGSTKNIILAPHAKTAYCFALGVENLDAKSGIRSVQPTELRQGMTAENRQQLNAAIVDRLETLANSSNEMTTWSVEVEGAVFEDGGFVGTNNKNFFDQLDARIKGARSVIDAALDRINGGRDLDSVQSEFCQLNSVNMNTEELLKPFNGDIAKASQDLEFQYRMGAGLVTQFLSAKRDGLQYIKDADRALVKLTKLN